MTRPSPRLWPSLLLGGIATIPSAMAAQIAPQTNVPLPPLGSVQPLLVQGEAGEAGLALVPDPDAAFAIRLALVDAHLRAALDARRAGFDDEAMGLVGHPEAEVMGELRPELEARGVTDFSDELDAYSEMIFNGAEDADLQAAYSGLANDIRAAMRDGGASDAVVFQAMQALVKGAAIEYEAVTQDGDDPVATLEALGFLAVAREMATEFARGRDRALADAGTKAIKALDGAASMLAAAEMPDPTILHAAAAWVELAGLQLQ